MTFSADAHARRRRAMLWLTGIVPAGVLWRHAPLHLSPLAFKYGGSVLWAAMVYWLVVLARPCRRGLTVAAWAAILAAAVEFGKKIYWPPLDRFRETLAGKLLLGRFFSYGALVAYLAAIAITLGIDRFQDSLADPRATKSGEI